MKKIFLITNIVLVVAVAALYVLFFTGIGKGKVATGHNASAMANPSELKLAFINTDTLLNNYDRFYELRKELTDKQQRFETDLNSKQVQLQKKYTDFQAKVQKGLLLRSEIQQIDQQLSAEGQNFQQLQSDYNQQLNEEMQVMNRKLYDDIVQFLKEYNKDYNYTFILSENGLLYANQSLDITWDVVKKMNEKFKAEKAKK